MAAGKNKILRWLRIFVNGYNLSGDARNIGEMANAFEAVDMTGWSQALRRYLPNMRRQVGVNGFQALANDTSLSGAHSVMKTPGDVNVSVLFGALAEPTYGDPAYLLSGAQINAAMGWDGEAAVISGNFVPDGGASDYSPLGLVLHPETGRSATFTGTALDNGAASLVGWQANLHLTTAVSGNFALIIEHSATGAWAGEQATLGSFTLTGAAVGSENISGAGTVERYVRLKGTRTAGSITPVVTFARE